MLRVFRRLVRTPTGGIRTPVLVATTAGALLLAGCEQVTTVLPDPPPGSPGQPGGGPGGPGTVLRGDLRLRVLVDPADVVTARSLGWDSAVPNVEVVLRRTSSGSAVTAMADSTGSALFSGLVEGSYSVALYRGLSATERGRLGPGDGDITGWGGGGTVMIAAPYTDTALVSSAGRRGSLVISEFQFSQVEAGATYRYGGYIELYNNSDTIVFLDGKIFGAGQLYYRDYQPAKPCDVLSPFRLDPRGLRSVWFYRFPGAGRSYPVAPGAVVVVAVDAVDHSDFVPGGLDLRQAPFELIGGSDVDNPGVPNLTSVGTQYDQFGGHGMYFPELDDTPWVADSMDLNGLQTDPPPNGGTTLYALVPKEKILDLAVFLSTYESPETPFCSPLIDAGFDRQPGRFLPGTFSGVSLHRRIQGTTPDGRPILLRTHTTARDFEVRPVSPGSVP